MRTVNPYESPEKDASTKTRLSRLKLLGTMVLVVGLIVGTYGAIAFWLVKGLPPNGGVNGRLPSLYVMGVGGTSAILGLVLRDLRFPSQKKNKQGAR